MPKFKHITDERMFRVMEHVGGTKKEFCENIGASPGNLQNIRNGLQSFTIAQILQCCKVYNISANYIFGLSKDMIRGSESKYQAIITDIQNLLDKKL